MEELDDSALLHRYAENQSDEKFAALVTRHINLVYSVALRETGSPENAEEIVQAVFIILARKARQLRYEKALSSWLFQATRLTSANFLRSESRRLNREQEAYMQSTLNEAPADETWMKIEPLLDGAVGSLREKDRRAILLRFYEGRNLQEVGAAMGASENAAGKRVNRALDHLRDYFAKRGVSSTTAIIGEKISAYSVQDAPVALAKAVAAAACAKGSAGSVSTLTLVKGAMKIMAWTKAKTAIVIGAGILLAGGTASVAVKTIETSRQEATYEYLFAHPDASSMQRLAGTAPVVVIRPTQHPDDGRGFIPPMKHPLGGRGYITPTNKGSKWLFVDEPMAELLAWAYGGDSFRVSLPDNLPQGNFDYLNTMPQADEALREQLKKQFGLVARKEILPADVLLLVVSDSARLQSFRTRGGWYTCYGTAKGNTQYRYFTNAPLSLLAAQIVQGYFRKPCIDKTDPNAKYDFAIQWDEPEGLSGEERFKALQPVMKERLSQLGLDLVTTNMPIETLVAENVK